MNLAELGLIIFEAQKAEWKDNGFEHFVWRMTQMLDHEVDADDLQDFYLKEKWIDKQSGEESKDE